MPNRVVLFQNLHVNTTYSSFIKSLADLFRTEFFPRSKEIVISTYEKCVERERKRREEASENYSPRFPFLTINPEMNFEPEEKAGRFFYNYPGFMNFFGAQQWSPRIYEDSNLFLAPVFNRYRGDIEIIVWAASVYEIIDLRARSFQFFGGLERILKPNFEGYFIFPGEIRLYKYENPYTDESYYIDWSKSLAETFLIKVINQNKMIWPFQISPMIKLTGVSDGSDRYGNPSEDAISEHRIILSLSWESWIPVHLALVSEAFPPICHSFEIDLEIGYQYSRISEDVGRTVSVPIHKIATYLDSTDSTSLTRVDLIWDQTFAYFLTASDIETFAEDNDVTVTLPDEIADCSYLQILSKLGKLTRDFTWALEGAKTVKLLGYQLKQLDFEEGDMLSFEIYKEDRV